jgi:hypothetical protein
MILEDLFNNIPLQDLNDLKLKAIQLLAPGTENYTFHLNYTLNNLVQEYYINKIREHL